MIEDRKLAGVAQLTRTYKGIDYTCHVAPVSETTWTFRVEGGSVDKDFGVRTNPPTAQSFLPDAHASGWYWWNVEGKDNTKGRTQRAEARTEQAAERKAARALHQTDRAARKAEQGMTQQPRRRTSKCVYKMRNQGGMKDGQIHYFCAACLDAFIVPAADGEPKACPQGHATRDELSLSVAA